LKIRHKFVSNSSSASFIILWSNREHKSLTKEEAIKKLFDYSKFDSEKKLKIINDLIKQTKATKTGKFKTEFFTSMFNDLECFGQPCLQLLAYLCFNEEFEIEYKKVEKDGG